MENEQFYDEPFLVTLSIEGSQYEEVEVEVTDPMKTIRDQINKIVEVFELQKMDSNGTPITYRLGQMNDDVEPFIFEFEDEQGRYQTLSDYNVQSGDRLVLVKEVIAG